MMLSCNLRSRLTLFSIINSLLLALGLLLFPSLAKGETEESEKKHTNSSLTEQGNYYQFTVFPVGINLARRSVNASALVKGVEDGGEAINFEQWLIPFDIVIEALNITATTLDNGELELHSPGIVTTLDPKQLQTDEDLGLVFTVAEIRDILGVTTEFDLQEYAIRFIPPWLHLKKSNTVENIPISLEGLTKINPANFTFTSLGQKLRLSNNDLDERDFSSRSDFVALGTILGGSWYTKVNQSNLTDIQSWQLGELQYLRQTDSIDFALGSQSDFWNSPHDGQYWGLTTIKRFGFTPYNNLASNGFNPHFRRQPQAINRSITGTANPGDVVHLVTRRRQEVIQEIIVDDGGIYQFEGVDVRNHHYQILIYPNGRLSAVPEIREPILTHVSGQLSKGTSTIATSIGMKRNLSGESFFGNSEGIAGGFNYRRGVTEQLTLGTGLVVDRSLFALGELFYQPTNIPLRLGISTLINPQLKDTDYAVYFNYQPWDKLNINFNDSSSSHDLRLNWRALNNLAFRLGNNNRDSITAGLTFSKSDRNFSQLITIDYGSNRGLSQRIYSRFNTLQFAHQGDKDSTSSRFSYFLSNHDSNLRKHALFIGYDTRNSSDSNGVINLGWNYRSSQQASDGGSLWDIELGYGFNSQGMAPLVALTTRIIPGTSVRLSYEGISPDNDNSQIRFDVFPNLRLQGKPSLDNLNINKLRTQGGLFVRPFKDKNNNGQLDKGEEIYSDDLELLVIINNKPLESLRHKITNQGVFIPLSSGDYRLDLDPGGYPFNWQPQESAYAAQVIAGSYTPLNIPLNPSYTAIGVVTDSRGEPLAGARVKAIPKQSSKSILSITNSAGVYVLEGLSQDTYSITVDDRLIDVKTLDITLDSEPLQEVNIKISD